MKPILTPRQTELMAWIATGMKGDAIAGIMGIKRSTYYNHKQNIHARLDAQSDIEVLGKLGWLTVPMDVLTGVDAVPDGRASTVGPAGTSALADSWPWPGSIVEPR